MGDQAVAIAPRTRWDLRVLSVADRALFVDAGLEAHSSASAIDSIRKVWVSSNALVLPIDLCSSS